MASPEVALENLLIAVLESAQKAKDAGDDGALFAYHDVLDIGLAEAKDNGVDLRSKELAELDPYTLIAGKPKRNAG